MNSYIQDYWRELDNLRRVAGAENEGSVSQAFAVLLRASGQEHKLILKQQHEFKGKGGTVPGGAATVLDLPLDPKKELKSLTVRLLANEVVIGLMAVTLAR